MSAGIYWRSKKILEKSMWYESDFFDACGMLGDVKI
jgi:hypothetical protein